MSTFMDTMSFVFKGPQSLNTYAATAEDDTLIAERSATVRKGAKAVMIVSSVVAAVALLVLLAVFAAPVIPVIATSAAAVAALMGGTVTGAAAAGVLGLSIATFVLGAVAFNAHKPRLLLDF